MPDSELRLTEPLAALSVATDLARGQPAEHALCASIIATRLAEYLGLSTEDRATTYFATLLRFAGCTATSHEYALHLGGNDVAVRFSGDAIDPGDPSQLADLLTSLGIDSIGPANAMQFVAEGTRADCEAGARTATRLGLGKNVADSLLHIFERWDGHGLPNGVSGEDIPLVARIGHVASSAVMFSQARGPSAAVGTLGKWSGGILDPAITASFVAHADELLSCLELPDVWQAALAAEPTPWRIVKDDSLDDICRIFGDFIDLKTPSCSGIPPRSLGSRKEQRGRCT